MGNVAKPRYHHNRQPNAKSESAWELKPIRVGPLMVCRTFFHLTRPAANDGEGLRAAWWPTAPALVEQGRQRRFKKMPALRKRTKCWAPMDQASRMKLI